jgi:hypothetical protein
MPELGVGEAAVGVDGIRHFLPASDLLGIPDTGSGFKFGSKGRGSMKNLACMKSRRTLDE